MPGGKKAVLCQREREIPFKKGTDCVACVPPFLSQCFTSGDFSICGKELHVLGSWSNLMADDCNASPSGTGEGGVCYEAFV